MASKKAGLVSVTRRTENGCEGVGSSTKIRLIESNAKCRYLITINVPLFKKLRDIIFLGGENHFMSHFEGHFEGPRLF